MATTIDSQVVALIKEWASAPPERAPEVLSRGKLRLDAMLAPQLVAEVAEITAEQLLVVLDLPSEKKSADEPVVPFLGLELNQQQGHRAAAWLDEHHLLADALGLSIETWSERVRSGMQNVIEKWRGRPLGALSSEIAHTVSDGALASATKGFQGGVDPSQSAAAGLRGILAARDFGKKKPN